MQSSGYKVRFASLSVDTALTAHVIDYSYDDIGRLQDAVYADSSRSYSYDYDVAGNRLQEQVMIDNTGTPVITTTNWTYNNANQIATMQVGSNPVSNFQYDANGNLTSDGQLAYTWDRANRLTTLNNGSYNTHYAYDGNSNRVQQTIGGIATDYLLDIQPQLALVLKETTPSETMTYVHSPKGVHSVEDNTDDWHFILSDGLGSVRSQVDDLAQIEASQAYSPYGQVYGVEGTFAGSFGYTGEQVDESGLSYLRARYYDPTQATFASLDPFEGKSCTPMSLNGYAYVHGNPIMNTDPTGMMVAGRRVNMDMSGTSRILQSWANTLKHTFTLPSLSLVKSMNSGMCGGQSVPSKRNMTFYRSGGSDVNFCIRTPLGNIGNCSTPEPTNVLPTPLVVIPSITPTSTGTSTPTAISTSIPSPTSTPSATSTPIPSPTSTPTAQGGFRLPMDNATLTSAGCLSRRVTSTFVPCSRDLNPLGQSGAGHQLYAPNLNGIVWYAGIGGAGLGNVVILKYQV